MVKKMKKKSQLLTRVTIGQVPKKDDL